MTELKDLTAEEVAQFIRAVVNTAREMDRPVNLDDITPEYVIKGITLQRNIAANFEVLKSNAAEVKAGIRHQGDVLEGIVARTRRKKSH